MIELLAELAGSKVCARSGIFAFSDFLNVPDLLYTLALASNS